MRVTVSFDRITNVVYGKYSQRSLRIEYQQKNENSSTGYEVDASKKANISRRKIEQRARDSYKHLCQYSNVK